MNNYRLDEIPSDQYLEKVRKYSSSDRSLDFQEQLEETYEARNLTFPEEPRVYTVRPTGLGAAIGGISGGVTGAQIASGQPEQILSALAIGSTGIFLGNEIEYRWIKRQLEN